MYANLTSVSLKTYVSCLTNTDMKRFATNTIITLVSQAVKDTIWLFEQEQALGFSSVSTNIRMTVIKLKSGELWVHAPIAPTKECIQVTQKTSLTAILFSLHNIGSIQITYLLSHYINEVKWSNRDSKNSCT